MTNVKTFGPLLVLMISFVLQSAVAWRRIRMRSEIEKSDRERRSIHYDILNIKGFVDGAGDIRKICARLDQGVSIAVFQIKCVQNGKLDGEYGEKASTIIKDSILRIKSSLRKHDLFCHVDSNIFALLLPFTDLEKGKLACLRLRSAIYEDLISNGAANNLICSIAFGVSDVPKGDASVLPGLERATKAMIDAVKSEKDISIF